MHMITVTNVVEVKLENMEVSMGTLEATMQRGFQELMRMIEGLNRQREGKPEGSQGSVNETMKEDEGEKDDGSNDGGRDEPNDNGVGGLNGVGGSGPYNYGRQCRVLVQILDGAGNQTWTGLKEAMVLRFGGRNQGPVFERLATSKQLGIVEEYDQPPNGKELLEPNGSNVRGLSELNSSRHLDPNVRERAEPKERGLVESNGRRTDEFEREGDCRNRTAEPKERGPTELNGRGQSELNASNGRKNEGVGRKGRSRNQCPGERTMNLVKRWASKKNRGLAVFDTRAEGREQRELLKDIEDHFLKAYDSGKMVTRMLDEEWKTLEEVLPPPKPPDLNGRATARVPAI
ncbi:hypothetical protein V8G54_036108 [Vigna mungo]|uniref:Uncharacterized protein n=1 Tax=Vigna mungo TaxID=3915 RepID=A0AAQ3MG77_VIGMU